MASLDERAAVLRHEMVDALASKISDARILDAMRRVPRHRFVERFAGAPPGENAWSLEGMREWVVDEGADDETLAMVHEGRRALPAAGSTPTSLTTSVSAPDIVASMLEELELEPGMRVLEIGTGSGYNAALLAELVDDPALVTTIDIDSSLIEPARGRLDRLGYGRVAVVEGDGDDGVPARAPFDRIIGTVGCNDLSPAWFQQLAPGGAMLVPVHHGAGHPLVLAHGDHTSVIAGPSGFVSVQGRQGEPVWWQPRGPFLPDRVMWEPSPLPELAGEPAWDVAFYVALRDRRSASMTPMLVDGQSVALLDAERGLGQYGPHGPALAARLASLVDDWKAIGAPLMRQFTATWQPHATGEHVDSRAGPWLIPRLHHEEIVEIPDRPDAS